LLDAVCDLLPEVPFSLLQATGHIGSGGTELLAKGRIETFDLPGNFQSLHQLARRLKRVAGATRRPKQDKGSNQHGDEQ